MNNSHTCKASYVTPGMPALDTSGKALSFFEFWPTWLMYIPVVLQWFALSIRYRSMTLPLRANPSLPLSGMVGVGKSELMAQATGECDKAILPWFNYIINNNESLAVQTEKLIAEALHQSILLPFVCKPDIGCRGVGVKLIENKAQLTEYLNSYPSGTSVILQKLSRWEPEAGVFFVRQPEQPKGKIISLALKYMPYVVGDGKQTLAQLIANDPRASQLSHLYLDRHKNKLDQVIDAGTPYRLVFAASHSRGAIFRDARDLITPELTDRMNTMMQDLPEFYYGRLDIKFSDIAALTQGRDLEVVEINTASSESLHIWDRKATLKEAVSSLLFQYRILFKLGHQNRQRGYTTPSVGELLRRWKSERKLHNFYPMTD